MKFHNTSISDCLRLELDKRGDDRGFFARLFCVEEFSSAGYPLEIVQANDSFSADLGTLRGMHYQVGDSEETKVIRCLMGAIYDVVLDLRPKSLSYMKWEGFYLDSENRSMIRVPKGCAHGFLTMKPNTEVFYLVDSYYNPITERGVRWNDKKFGIIWPNEPRILSEKDANWPDY